MITWYIVWILTFLFGLWVGIIAGYYMACKDHNITDIYEKK